MKLLDLLACIDVRSVTYPPQPIEVTGISIDSRKVKPGHLFVALKGTQTDGHDHIPDALAAGATVIVHQGVVNMEQTPDRCYIQVDDTQDAAGRVATAFYGHPSSKLKLIGVTGTNGKTTTATLLYKLFEKLGHKTGLISTVCNYINDEAVPTGHTTPDPVTLNQLLARMVDAGCRYAFMEVSSHAIEQKRISGLTFTGGIFTNLTRDHMDYHGSMENYLKAKKTFFDGLPKSAFALTNLDDKNGLVMTQNTRSKVAVYSLRGLSDFKGRILEQHFDGTLLDFNGKELFVQFVGRFNAYNLLAVFGTAVLLGKEEEEVLLALSTLTPVDGRFETLQSEKGYTAIVDYAHTPDALVNVLSTIREVMQGKGNIITVVGAGGDRDKGKRPIMAKESARFSDRLIITSDNPRYEDPQAIINDMLAGLSNDDRKKTIAIADRREAIRTACMLATRGDVVLIAGKGHEKYQDIKGVKHPFDDKEELKELTIN